MQNVDPAAAQNFPVYKLTHEALAPLGSGHDDAPAAAIIAGSKVEDQHYDAAHAQYQYRKALWTLGHATLDEVKESRKRETMVLVDSKLPLPTGGDFAQHVLNQVDAFEAQMKTNNEELKASNEELKAALQALKTQMEQNHEELKAAEKALKTQMEQCHEELKAANQALKTQMELNTGAIQAMNATLIQVAIQTAKNANRSILRCEMLAKVPNDQGDLPDNLAFPQTYEDLMNMEEHGLNGLLTFYGIHLNERVDLDQRKELLCHHLGLVLDRN